MLDLMDVLKLLADGKKLPQEMLPGPTEEEASALQDAEPAILNKLFEGMEHNGDPADLIMTELEKLSTKYHWFAVAGVLCMCFGTRYRPDQIPALPNVTQETLGLLRMLPMATEHAKSDDGAWTIPMAMLADLGRDEALGFTACAGLCAGVGYIQSHMEAGS